MITSISEYTRLWEKALKKIAEKINEKKTFDSFFANSYIYDIKGNKIIVAVTSLVAKTVLNGQYKELINSVVSDLTEEEYVIEVFTEDELEKANKKVVSGGNKVEKENKKQNVC